LAVALAWGSAQRWVEGLLSYLWVFSVIGGVLLAGLGFLLFFGRYSLLIQWGYRLFNFMSYEKIIDYL